MNIQRLRSEMGYVPSVENRLKLYDGIEIDINTTWAQGLGVMHVEILKIFNQGRDSGAYFYISDQGLNLLKVNETEQRVELMNSRYSREFIQQVSIF
jgi:hypothetical protein